MLFNVEDERGLTVKDTMIYLCECYLRNNSESSFVQNKKLTGWKVEQKRNDRIAIAMFTEIS